MVLRLINVNQCLEPKILDLEVRLRVGKVLVTLYHLSKRQYLILI